MTKQFNLERHFKKIYKNKKLKSLKKLKAFFKY